MRPKAIFIAAVLFAALLPGGCGYNYMVQGRVVDAVTKEPVQGAVVAVHWYRKEYISFIIPLTSGQEDVAYADTVTDADGAFTIPRYFHVTGGHDLGVYKEGYICWYNKDKFNPDAKTAMQWVLPRKDPGVSDGMVIELEPIKGEEFPSLQHAMYVNTVGLQFYGKFTDATLQERMIERNEIERLKKTQ